ncbi:DUF559 domain-containing protein [Stakelama marina]|uniref:DUF559 domain-containing protein n=1 Tax=Stakelama marina TaxID=2826939 RepID=UPI003D36E748
METRTKARRLRRDATPAERRLWEFLRARQVAGVRFNRQGPHWSFRVRLCLPGC